MVRVAKITLLCLETLELDMKKRLFIQILIISSALFCGCGNNAHESESAISDNSVSSSALSSTMEGMNQGDDVETVKNWAPGSFSASILEIDGQMIMAMTNGRYYLFRAPSDMGSLVEGEAYLYEKYDQLTIRYNPDFMSGDGIMEDLEVRGEYHQGVSDLKMVSADISTLLVPEGFEISELKDGDSKFYVWSDGRYYIFRAICNEYEDWYILDSDDKMYMRYEPSFMSGR